MRFRWVMSAALTVSIAALCWLGFRVTQQNARIADLEAQLARGSRSVESTGPPGPVATPPSQSQQPHGTPAHPQQKPGTAVPTADVERLREQWLSATSSVAGLQAKIEELRTRLDETAAEQARAVSAESEARSRAEELQRSVDAISAERAALDKRLKDLQADNDRLRASAVTASQKDRESARVAAELQDLLKRQQNHMSNIVTRYRTLADQVRSASAEGEGKSAITDRSRIDFALSSAEEDLQALRDLNARIARLQKQITQAK